MPLITTSLEEVRHKFSRSGAAHKWNSMYASDTEHLDEVNYRIRRDIAVAQVLARITPTARVLDLGCGTGPVLSELRRRGINVAGLDCSPDMLAYARERLRATGLEDSNLFVGDCRKTAFPDASVDIVVCLGVISYVEDYERVLGEMHRLLKPGGTMILSFRNKFRPILSDPAALAKHVAKRLLSLPRRRGGEKFAIGRLLDHRLVTRQVELLGFRFVDFFGIGFGPFCIAGRSLFGERQSIAVSRGLHAFFMAIQLRRPLPWLTDISLWIYQKPHEGHGREPLRTTNERC